MTIVDTTHDLKFLNCVNTYLEIKKVIREESKKTKTQQTQMLAEFEQKFFNNLKLLAYKAFIESNPHYLKTSKMIKNAASFNNDLDGKGEVSSTTSGHEKTEEELAQTAKQLLSKMDDLFSNLYKISPTPKSSMKRNKSAHKKRLSDEKRAVTNNTDTPLPEELRQQGLIEDTPPRHFKKKPLKPGARASNQRASRKAVAQKQYKSVDLTRDPPFTNPLADKRSGAKKAKKEDVSRREAGAGRQQKPKGSQIRRKQPSGGKKALSKVKTEYRPKSKRKIKKRMMNSPDQAIRRALRAKAAQTPQKGKEQSNFPKLQFKTKTWSPKQQAPKKIQQAAKQPQKTPRQPQKSLNTTRSPITDSLDVITEVNSSDFVSTIKSPIRFASPPANLRNSLTNSSRKAQPRSVSGGRQSGIYYSSDPRLSERTFAATASPRGLPRGGRVPFGARGNPFVNRAPGLPVRGVVGLGGPILPTFLKKVNSEVTKTIKNTSKTQISILIKK